MSRWHLGGSAQGYKGTQKDMASPGFPEFKGNYAFSCPFVTLIRLLRNQQVNQIILAPHPLTDNTGAVP